METAKITFYNIDRCGLYKFGQETPELGNIANFMSQLEYWAKFAGKPLEETCTYALEESEDVHNTYCYDIISNPNNGDYLLTTWNETPSYEGKVAAVKRKSSVGNAKVEFTKLPKDSIPGYATYFWFVPRMNVFATIRFTDRQNGKANLDKYMKEFIAKLSDYVVLDPDPDSDFSIIGYSQDGLTNPKHLNGYFSTSIVRKPGQIDFIRNNIGNIRKVVRHNRLIPSNSVSQQLWQLALIKLNLKKMKPLTTEINFSYEFSFKPSVSELDEIINEWIQNHDAKWDDVGFVLKGQQTPVWLSSSVAKDEAVLDVKRIDDAIVDASSILDEITKQRSSLLSLLS